jgi:hypothetical protein
MLNGNTVERKTIEKYPELFKYKKGETVYYVFTTVVDADHAHSQVFAGVVTGGEIFDDSCVIYNINDVRLTETDLFKTHEEANAKAIMKQSTDFVGELTNIFKNARYRVQGLADFIYCNYTAVIDIPEETKVTCDAVAQNGNVEHNFDVFKADRLLITDEGLCYDISYGKVNSTETVSVYDLLSPDMELIRIIDILETYIKKHILHEDIEEAE